MTTTISDMIPPPSQQQQQQQHNNDDNTNYNELKHSSSIQFNNNNISNSNNATPRFYMKSTTRTMITTRIITSTNVMIMMARPGILAVNRTAMVKQASFFLQPLQLVHCPPACDTCHLRTVGGWAQTRGRAAGTVKAVLDPICAVCTRHHSLLLGA